MTQLAIEDTPERHKRDVLQLAMFVQATDARENGYRDENGWHPTWEEASAAHEEYKADADTTLKAVKMLGYLPLIEIEETETA